MQDLMLPVRHDWLVRERAYGKIVIEPFEPGFAVTAGTAYRRVLLSSIAGAAPTWVKIEHVLHEFSYLPGVREDTLDIILNLRKLVFTVHVNRPKLLRLKVQRPSPICSRPRTSARSRSTRSRPSWERWDCPSALMSILRSWNASAPTTSAPSRPDASLAPHVSRLAARISGSSPAFAESRWLMPTRFTL